MMMCVLLPAAKYERTPQLSKIKLFERLYCFSELKAISLWRGLTALNVFCFSKQAERVAADWRQSATKTLIEQERKSYSLDSEAEKSSQQDDFTLLLEDIALRGSRLPVAGSNDA